MDLVAKEFILLSYFWLSLGAFGAFIEPFPENKAVLAGTTNVTFSCSSSLGTKAVNWNYNPVGSNKTRVIRIGKVVNPEFGGYENSSSKSYTMVIKIANASYAGTYICNEGLTLSAQLIVLSENPTCNYAPKETKQLLCNETLQLSCTVRYAAKASYVVPMLKWTTEASPESLSSSIERSASGNITTATSTLSVTWPKNGDIPIYRCNTTFGVNANLSKELVKKEPKYQNLCTPFTSPNDVPCIKVEDKKTTVATKPTTDATDNPEKKIDDTGGGWSVGLSDTGNIVIRVFGVAGVLLLAQVLEFEEE